MNLEAINKWLDEEYGCSYTRLEELHDFYFEKYCDLQQENKKLKEQLSVTQTNEETFRLEMVDITKILGLDEHTLFDDVKVYARSLKDNWNKLKEFMKKEYDYLDKYSTPAYGCAMGEINRIKNKMQELEKGVGVSDVED